MAAIKDIDAAQLIPQVANGVIELDEKLTKVTSLAETTQKAVTLLLPLLGADGQRIYLVVFQNPAELRATGGIFGAYAIITADHGKIEMVKQGATSGDIPKFDPPIVQLPKEEQDLYTDRLAMWATDVNFSPDFPTGAKLIREMYRQTFRLEVDRVIAADPVAFAAILRGTGPITLPNGDALDAKSAVTYLLKTAYAKATFMALVSGQGSTGGILTGLQSAASEHRLLMWSDFESEQKILATTTLGGVLPTNDGARPLIGIFLNDGTGGNMDYYLRQDVTVKTTACRADGEQVYLAGGIENGCHVGILTIGLEPGESKSLAATVLTGPLPAQGL